MIVEHTTNVIRNWVHAHPVYFGIIVLVLAVVMEFIGLILAILLISGWGDS